MSCTLISERTEALTPLRRVPTALAARLGFPESCIVCFKDETANRGGSSKARVARSLIAEGWRSGAITSTTEIVLPSSGSTALAMADETERQHLALRVFLSEATLASKIAELQRYPNVHIVKVAGSSEDARQAADDYVAAASGRRVWLADQYNLPAAVMAHALTTAPEILKQTEGRVTHTFAGIGTGSTSAALALVFRPLGIEVIGVEPKATKHALVGLKYTPDLPPDLIPLNLRIDLLSDVKFVSDDEALAMTRLLVRHGFRFGPSTGAVCVAARDFAAGLDGRAAYFVLIGHDSATHYSNLFSEEVHHA
ncbi:MAG: cystathionine beta-synthase [Thermoanaerobaculia bacterium]|nr:cystathionine beta-synthase [Thermoanaerobaculia bacterium]